LEAHHQITVEEVLEEMHTKEAMAVVVPVLAVIPVLEEGFNPELPMMAQAVVELRVLPVVDLLVLVLVAVLVF
jgi:hypothetical protein